MGPPGSASVIARPATNGARTTRGHSASLKSLLVVTDATPPGTGSSRNRGPGGPTTSSPLGGELLARGPVAGGIERGMGARGTSTTEGDGMHNRTLGTGEAA